MEINNISFKSSLLNQMQQKSVAATPAVVKNDSFELQNPKQKKNINKKTLIGTIAAGVVFVLGFVLPIELCLLQDLLLLLTIISVLQLSL